MPNQLIFDHKDHVIVSVSLLTLNMNCIKIGIFIVYPLGTLRFFSMDKIIKTVTESNYAGNLAIS